MEREQLESAAVSYAGLRGLFSVPLGVMMIAGGLGNMEWGPFRQLWTVPFVLALAGLAALLIHRYYNDNYGQVTLSRKSQVKAIVAVVVCLPVIFVGLMDRWPDLPVWSFLAAWSLMMLISYALSAGLNTHRLVIWGSLLVAALLPVWAALGPDLKSNVGLLVGGAAIMATGVLDHRVLVRRFGSAGERDLEGGSAGA